MRRERPVYPLANLTADIVASVPEETKRILSIEGTKLFTLAPIFCLLSFAIFSATGTLHPPLPQDEHAEGPQPLPPGPRFCSYELGLAGTHLGIKIAAFAQLGARGSHNPKVVSLILTGRTCASSKVVQWARVALTTQLSKKTVLHCTYALVPR